MIAALTLAMFTLGYVKPSLLSADRERFFVLLSSTVEE
jgi:hypothetical protein